MNAPMVNERLQAALGYAQRGWHVFPVFEIGSHSQCSCDKGADCKHPGKHPRVSNWREESTTDERQIGNWWTRWPAANVGIMTGVKSGLTVVDADGANGKPGVVNLTRISAEHGGWPQTYKVKTGSGEGYQLYFLYSDGLPNGNDALGEAIDVKSEGGYVVAPPSNHKSGGTYVVEQEVGLLALPDWLRSPELHGETRRRRRAVDLSLEEVESALAVIDPDDRDIWLNVGVILGREYNQSAEAWSIYEAWSAGTPLFEEDRAGNLLRMREMFYERSHEAPRAGREQLSMGTLVKLARDGGWQRPTRLRDSDHYRLAQGLVDEIANETGERPVYAMGSLWRVQNDLWTPWSMNEVAVEVGRRFGGGKLCRKGGDFAAVARIAAGIVLNETFFADTPVGFAAPRGFWRIAEGEIVCEPLTAAHRQRMRLAADPVLGGRPARLLKMLREAFEGEHPEEQLKLLQQVTGCALTRTLWRHEMAVLLLGVTSSGKSTFLGVLREAFPREARSATSPARWGQEYYVAQLAGKALNIVGELDGLEPIPGGRFKTITGRDLVDGRHPTHQPFSFVCEAAHFFNSNRTPPTTDRDDSFFRRWRILKFVNPAGNVIRDLDKLILAEEFGEFLGWGLEGALLVAREGSIMETEPHREALKRWRMNNNSALEFLSDRACALDPQASAKGQALFDAYRMWADEAGVKAFGRSGFYEAIERGGAVLGVRLTRRDHQVVVDGVRLLWASSQL